MDADLCNYSDFAATLPFIALYEDNLPSSAVLSWKERNFTRVNIIIDPSFGLKTYIAMQCQRTKRQSRQVSILDIVIGHLMLTAFVTDVTILDVMIYKIFEFSDKGIPRKKWCKQTIYEN